MFPGRRRRSFVSALVATIVLGCASAPSGTGTPPVEAQEEPAVESSGAEAAGGISATAAEASHARMVEALDAIRREAARTNGFLGEEPVPELRARLATLPGEPSPERWRTLRDLAAHELRLGRNADAVAHLEEAYAMLPALAESMPPQAAIGTVLATAVGHLRLGEVKNCRTRHNADSCILPIRGAGVHVDRGGSERAIEHLTTVLENTGSGTPEHLTARWLLNIAFMTLGEYPEGVPDAWRIELSQYGDDTAISRFRNVAAELGVDVLDLAGGTVVDDLNGDGVLDWLTSTSDTGGGMRLFLGNGEGGFEDATARSGLDGMLGGLNMTAADYDNDGDVDVVVLRGGWWGARGRHPNSLLRNDGRGRFRDVAHAAGLAEPAFPTQTAAWADVDLDGDLDLYVGNEHEPGVDAPGQLFLNRGDGTFTEAAAAAGVTNRRYAKAVAFGDVDEDGDPDLFVSNLNGDNRLYRNDGDADGDGVPSFVDVAGAAGVTRPFASFPAWFWDFDQDGHLDLFVAAYGGRGVPPEVWTVAAGVLGREHPAESPIVYLGNGKGGFRPLAASGPLARPSLPMGANFGDVDNDGWLDVYVGTGYPHYDGLMPNELWRNVNGTALREATVSSGLGHLQKGHAVAFADFDDDGDLDLFEQLGGAYPGDAFGNALFRNPGSAGAGFRVELEGVAAPRDGQGTRLALTVEGPSGRRTLHGLAGGGGSFGVSPLSRVHFGLGDAERRVALEVRWTSGRVDRFDAAALEGAGPVFRCREGDAPRPAASGGAGGHDSGRGAATGRPAAAGHSSARSYQRTSQNFPNFVPTSR